MASGGGKETIRVPFLDLAPAHAALREGLLEDFGTLIDSGAFANGPAVAEFEQAFAAYCGVMRCLGMASGLDALRLGLLAAGLEPGDEVVVPAMTFVATLEAVTQAGGTPVLADISDEDYNLDPGAAAAALTRRTRLILPVHLYGQMADMVSLTTIAERTGVRVVEDACQAQGAERDGRRAGTSGVASAFSFYPGKNLGAMGDAGALVTNDAELAERVRMLREHGQRAKYEHAIEGYTARLDTMQALVLLRKLPQLDEWNAQRSALARAYGELLEGLGDLILPRTARGSAPVWHLYVVRTSDPAGLGAFLSERGIGAGRHYPTPVHLTEAYRGLGHGAGAFPAAERLGAECLSLPIFPGMSPAQLEAVVDAVAAYFARRSSPRLPRRASGAVA